ncbi:RagB/SusD family nutrient uptake outer membrane protein [Niabella sp.]|uniref:RagB/SusD family nutrient uptake outer membrane protein n=1 Tax=Niabella sp. TaxID=1962976 RepID=UPI00260A326A|nr:RagB/SusD family nutrient uptake outer membrane protein [Niabella sp.]
MKAINKYIIGIIGALLILTGCSKFLDRPTENQQDAQLLDYTQLGNMYQPVSGLYRLAGGNNPGLIHWVDLGIRAVRGDDFTKGSTPQDQAGLSDIKNFSLGAVQSFFGLENSWNDYFGLIMKCNQALTELDKFGANIPSGDATNQKLYNQYKGEVRFIRAFTLLVASRVFGNVPIITDNSTVGSVPRSSIADARNFIMSEMDYCIANLEDAVPNKSIHVGAVTKYSALLLKAKAAADLAGNDNGNANWDIVISTTDQIINSGKCTLFPDFYNLFKIPGKLCDESLFELQYSDFGTGSGTSVSPDQFFAFQGPGGDQKGSPISGWGFIPPTNIIADFLKSRNDSVRIKTTLLNCGNPALVNTSGFLNSSSTTPSGDVVYGNTNNQIYFNGKAYLPVNQMTSGRTSYGSNNNVRVLRYADALLLNAEAKVRKGQNGDATFNLVRVRAKLSPITGVTLTQVLDERRAEFACEWWGERYNDLMRTGQAATALPGFTQNNAYLPVPQSQIDLNPNLK